MERLDPKGAEGLLRRAATVAVATAGLLTLAAPAAVAAVPQSPSNLPSSVDDLADYEGATTCAPVQPGTAELRGLIRDTYGKQTIGGTRACPVGTPVNSEHMDGRALDWMLDSADPGDAATAAEFLQWLVGDDADSDSAANARRLGVMYVIWDHRIWKAYRADQGWQQYTGPNPHTDHIHISLSRRGAAGETSWWTGESDPVDGHWVALGAGDSKLGQPVSGEYSYRGGTAKEYQNGTILWSRETNAHELSGAIEDVYFEQDMADAIGLPVSDELELPDRGGRVNHFEQGSVYWSPSTGAHEVRSGVRDAYAAQGWERGALGYPVTDEYASGDGQRRSDFQGGYITWTRDGGTVVHLH